MTSGGLFMNQLLHVAARIIWGVNQPGKTTGHHHHSAGSEMKFYIDQEVDPDFVCHAPTVGEAIVIFWKATGESPEASYEVHHGRRSEATTISAAEGFWSLEASLRSTLIAVVCENSSRSDYLRFCDAVIDIQIQKERSTDGN